MERDSLQHLQAAWPAIAPYLFVPHTDGEYRRLSTFLDLLIDTVGEDEQHPLASLMEVIGTLIEAYEGEHFQGEACS